MLRYALNVSSPEDYRVLPAYDNFVPSLRLAPSTLGLRLLLDLLCTVVFVFRVLLAFAPARP
jgi:hypothetical protein